MKTREKKTWGRYPCFRRGHCGRRKDELLRDASRLAEEIGDWSAWLAGPEDEELVEAVRRNTRTGRPAGSKAFVTRLEKLIGRAFSRRRAAARASKTLGSETM